MRTHFGGTKTLFFLNLIASMDPEGIDGVRMTWNIWRRTKLESTNCVVPVVHEHHHLTLRSAPLPRVFLSSKPLRNRRFRRQEMDLSSPLKRQHSQRPTSLTSSTLTTPRSSTLFPIDPIVRREQRSFSCLTRA